MKKNIVLFVLFFASALQESHANDKKTNNKGTSLNKFQKKSAETLLPIVKKLPDELKKSGQSSQDISDAICTSKKQEINLQVLDGQICSLEGVQKFVETLCGPNKQPDFRNEGSCFDNLKDKRPWDTKESSSEESAAILPKSSSASETKVEEKPAEKETQKEESGNDNKNEKNNNDNSIIDNVKDKIKEKVEDVKKEVEKKIEENKDAIKDKVEDVKSKIDEIKDKIKDNTAKSDASEGDAEAQQNDKASTPANKFKEKVTKLL